MKRVYIAGPMSGLPQFNFPAFYAAAELLRAAGYDVVSPAELDDAEDAELALNSKDGALGSVKKTWGDFLARDIKLLADGVESPSLDESDFTVHVEQLPIDGIVFLPGWQKSKGAKLEAFVGILSGKEFATFDMVDQLQDEKTFTLTPRSVGWVLLEINGQYAEELAIHAPLRTHSPFGVLGVRT